MYVSRQKNMVGQSKAFFIDSFFWSYLFLAVYKVIYQKLILDLRFAEFSWSQAFWAVGLGMGVSLLCFNFYGFSIGKKIVGIEEPDKTRPWNKQPWGAFCLVLLAVTFITGLHVSEVSLREFFSSAGIMGAKRIFSALVNPNFAIFQEVCLAAIETIYMAFIATAFALVPAFLLSFFAARNLMVSHPVLFSVYTLVRFFLNMTRAIEPLVWAIILSVWVGIGPFAGMLALMLHSIASLAKLYSEQIENIDDGPLEAMISTGAHPIQVIWYGVVPQIVLPFLSFTIYRWDINVRMATIIGLVGGGGIGTMLMQYQGLAKWNEVGLIVMVIAFIVWVMDYSSAKIREAIK